MKSVILGEKSKFRLFLNVIKIATATSKMYIESRVRAQNSNRINNNTLTIQGVYFITSWVEFLDVGTSNGILLFSRHGVAYVF